MAVVASAPGKVLMTGGYLVLEKPNAGIVLSTNARFYAVLKPLYDEVVEVEWIDVKVNSPQMSRETAYKMSLKDFTLNCSSESRNPFVEYAVQYSVAAAYTTLDKIKRSKLQKLLSQGMDITILGCNDFYSYRSQIEARGLPLVPESLAALPPFTSITFNAGDSNGENCKPEVAKTGLGSSAAMTTAVVAALLNYLGVVDLQCSGKDQKGEKSSDLDLVHMIAQTTHCIAQGKVGSGFDVSSAVYGSHRYVRFSPKIISAAQEAVCTTPLDEVIGEVLKAKWDHERTKFSLPPLMNLILGEPGSGGSSTPSMVGAVKKWQKSDPEKSKETWDRLSEANSALEAHFNLLSKLAAENWDSYKSVIDSCSMHKSEKWKGQFSEASHVEIVKALLGAREAMLKIRCHMRQMGEAAGIPIEPESQTRLLDVTMDTEGVLLAGVPGAGGFDAVFAITLGDSTATLTKTWSSHNVLALLVREDPCGVSLESGDPRAK
ncbi:putative phosphomevalonate kinase [Helianthus annuus]|nr:putative phosphomevalonate kinase [Helianthus annuus]